MVKYGWVGLCVLASALACVSPNDVRSSSTSLTTATINWYGNIPAGPAHFGTVSTVVVSPPGGPCNGPLGNQQIVSAWEQRTDTTGNTNASGVFVGVMCPNGTNPVFEAQVNIGLIAGNVDPAGWHSTVGAHAVYVGLPTLVPVGPPGWVALVALVGSDTPPGRDVTTATNIAIVLSQDGGIHWQDPHLVAATDNIQGGTDPGSVYEARVNATVFGTGLAATASSWTDPVNNTHDIFVAWTAFNSAPHSFFREVGWTNGGTWAPFPAASPLCVPLNEPSLVAGTHPTFGNFVFLLDPQIPTVQAANSCASIAVVHSPVVTQMWQQSIALPPFTQFSWSGQEGFVAGNPNPVCSPSPSANLTIPNWPQCVTGNRTSSAAVYDNIARAPVAYDSTANLIAAAVTRIRPSDSTNSTRIEIQGWHFTTCLGCDGGSGMAPPTTLTASLRDDHIPTTQPEDQFEPGFAFDNSSGKAAIYWYDTAESPAVQINYPSSLHGQVMPLSGSIPGGLKVFFPSPSYQLGQYLDLGGYIGAAPFGDGSHFGIAFTDGMNTPGAPNGKGGIYTTYIAP